MIASHRHRFIFFKTRKTAGTSVEAALSRLCGPDDVMRYVDAVIEKKAGENSHTLDFPGETPGTFFTNVNEARC